MEYATVAELIAELQKMPQDCRVFVRANNQFIQRGDPGIGQRLVEVHFEEDFEWEEGEPPAPTVIISA
jgi:hypothetical protein